MKTDKKFRTRSQIAQEFGISTKTLQKIIKKSGIDIPPRELIPHSLYKKIVDAINN